MKRGGSQIAGHVREVADRTDGADTGPCDSKSKIANNIGLVLFGRCLWIAWVKATITSSKCRNLEVYFAQFARLPKSIRSRAAS